MIKCDCIRGLIHPRFKMLNAGGDSPMCPELNFIYFECIYCGKLHEGQLK